MLAGGLESICVRDLPFLFWGVLAGCSESSSAPTCAVPSVNEDAGTCADGEVWVSGPYYHFNSFCGKLCQATADCPSQMHCVIGEYANPVCVSDTLPMPICRPDAANPNLQCINLAEGPSFACMDSQTLGTKYWSCYNGIAGYELTVCPNGCEADGPEGSSWGFTPGHCR